MECNWSMCWNLNTWDVFWLESATDEARCCRKGVSGRRVACAIRALVCSLSVLWSYISRCLGLFLCMVVRQWYERRRRGLVLELYRWTTSKVC